MNDIPPWVPDYDKWKTASPEDEQNDRQQEELFSADVYGMEE